MNEGKKSGLWSNMRKRRKKGLPRKKPGQKGYPKTLDIGESALRNIIRSQILREAGEMFWGRDAVLMQLSKASNAIETALMDMEDAGCPGDSFAHSHLETSLDDLEKAGRLGDTGMVYDEIVKILHSAQTAARNCREIDRETAYRVARDIDTVEKEIAEWARSENSGIEF